MEEQFKTLIVLSHYLEVCICFSFTWLEQLFEIRNSWTSLFQTGRFRQFWDEAAKSRHIVEAVPGNLCIAIYEIYEMIISCCHQWTLKNVPHTFWIYIHKSFNLDTCCSIQLCSVVNRVMSLGSLMVLLVTKLRQHISYELLHILLFLEEYIIVICLPFLK